MPGSMPEGKMFIKNFFLDKKFKWVLDVGPGSGNYYDLFMSEGEYQGWGPALTDTQWAAVEIWQPYFELFNLDRKYSVIHFVDIYDVNWEKLGWFDIVIMGDVLEHMSQERAEKVIKSAKQYCRWLVISLPIIEFPQGPSYGNEHEAHVETYSPEKMAKMLEPYDVVAQEEGAVIGVYIIC